MIKMFKEKFSKLHLHVFFLFFFFCFEVLPGFSQEANSADKPELSYQDLRMKLEESESLIQDNHKISANDILNLETLTGTIGNTYYHDLILNSSMLLFLAQEIKSLQDDSENKEMLYQLAVEDLKKERKEEGLKPANAISFWTSLGAGFVSLSLFNFFWYLSDQIYSTYVNTESITEAVQLRNSLLLYDNLGYIFAGISLFSFGVSITLLITGPSD